MGVTVPERRDHLQHQLFITTCCFAADSACAARRARSSLFRTSNGEGCRFDDSGASLDSDILYVFVNLWVGGATGPVELRQYPRVGVHVTFIT